MINKIFKKYLHQGDDQKSIKVLVKINLKKYGLKMYGVPTFPLGKGEKNKYLGR